MAVPGVATARILVDEIARQDDEIGAGAAHEILGGAEHGLAYEGGDLEIRELDNAVPVEAPPEARDPYGDFLERHQFDTRSRADTRDTPEPGPGSHGSGGIRRRAPPRSSRWRRWRPSGSSRRAV